MRRTKIICTVGPATESAGMLRKLVEAGTDVFRLNFSHGTVSGHQSVMRRIRAVAEETGKPVAILQDLPGPKIRLGVFKDGSVELHAGDRFRLTTEEVPGDYEYASVSYSKLPEEVRPGQSIVLADGTVELEVESVTRSEIVCRVVLGGVLTNHKGVNVVGGTSSLPAFTERDQKLLLRGLEAHIQKELISKAIQAAKPVVTATQMLRSMVENPRPSRAEVSDIANAVLDGSDALMLSEESAVGAYPVEAVKVLAETAAVAEARLFARRPFVSLSPADGISTSEAIAHAASLVAHQAKAAAIICCTRTGQTARLIAKYRPVQPIVAVTPEPQTVRPLMLVWGVQPFLVEEFTSIDAMTKAAIAVAFKKKVVRPGNKVVIVAAAPSAPQGQTDFLRVATLNDSP
jgi:pyruvate kinase